MDHPVYTVRATSMLLFYIKELYTFFTIYYRTLYKSPILIGATYTPIAEVRVYHTPPLPLYAFTA